jgi:hypothetical protein
MISSAAAISRRLGWFGESEEPAQAPRQLNQIGG